MFFVAGPTASIMVGAFIIVGRVTGFCYVALRNKRDEEECMEDNFLSGMPMRFTYQELRVATGDFQKKLVMEAVCGMKNLDWSQPEECVHLLPIFMRKVEEDQLVDMVDGRNQDMQLDYSEALQVMKAAIWCLQSDYRRRPSMSDVVKALEGNLDVEADLDYTMQNPTTVAATR
ncbi:hypothetical protein GH714_011898 [Hevea brasiliensis]|uniref:Serine-threonine/tyrosine-protein kinase catalytic domain-containing protein n=1 Tax=Hevea brasiliensis TaxID=3981 RepID=A0A6A6LNE4_HEVBR|nr:hypothetical protein GH714_011898 [Hevea brasiliensis]